MSEGRGALEGGPSGGLPARPLRAHCAAHQAEGLLEGAPDSPHPLGHLALGHRELVTQVIHGAGGARRGGGQGGARVGPLGSPCCTLARASSGLSLERKGGLFSSWTGSRSTPAEPVAGGIHGAR